MQRIQRIGDAQNRLAGFVDVQPFHVSLEAQDKIIPSDLEARAAQLMLPAEQPQEQLRIAQLLIGETGGDVTAHAEEVSSDSDGERLSADRADGQARAAT